MIHRFALVLLAASPALSAQEGSTLEEIRDWARSRIAARETEAKERVDRYARLFRTTPHGTDSAAAREAVASLAEQASVFPDLLLERVAAGDNADVRKHFADALVLAGDPALAGLCLDRVPGRPEEVAALLVRTAGRMKSVAATERLRALTATEGVPPAVRGEALIALARVGGAEAAQPVRAGLSDASPIVRRAACEAALFLPAAREESDEIRKLATSDSDDEVRRAALRALGRVKGDLESLKILHDVLAAGEPKSAAAALDALEAAGTRDLSGRPLLKAVKEGPPDLRLRAARVLMSLGNPEGVKTLFAALRRDAEASPELGDKQAELADRYREAGYYDGALIFYERALSARNGGIVQQQVLVSLARCYARLKRFDDVRRRLKQAGFGGLRVFADDPDFAEMRESPAHRDLFLK